MITKTPRIFALITAGTLCVMLISGFAITYAANPPPSGNVVPNFSALKVTGNTDIGGLASLKNGLAITGNIQSVANGGHVVINDQMKVNGLLEAMLGMYVYGTIQNPTGNLNLLVAVGKTIFLTGSKVQISDDVNIGGNLNVLSAITNVGGPVNPAPVVINDDLNITGFIRTWLNNDETPVRIDDTLQVNKDIDAQGSIKNSANNKAVLVDDNLDVTGAVDVKGKIKNSSGATPSATPVTIDDILEVLNGIKVTNKSRFYNDVDAQGDIANEKSGDNPVKINDDLEVEGNIRIGEPLTPKDVNLFGNLKGFTIDSQSIKNDKSDGSNTFPVTINDPDGLDIQSGGMLKRDGSYYIKTVSYTAGINDLGVKNNGKENDIYMHCGADEVPVYCNFRNIMPTFITITSLTTIDTGEANGCYVKAKNSGASTLYLQGTLTCLKK